ncbi:MAG TPA: ABC transporter ATP-binding protein [Candidatus Deferrimicrobiaceae bacterium]|nr:ABC transporter ATP-binding protein [Candidatus Deferrimicrobiaceae bacterium]
MTAGGRFEVARAAAVQAAGLRKAFGSIHAVDGVDMALAGGRIYGLLGPNGSGKTTLIRLMTGLAKPSGGEVHVLGTKMPSRDALSRIGYMPQAEALYPELSVGENLSFFARLEGRSQRAAMDRVLELVELGDRKGSPALELSGGMRRRLSLAITLVHEPPVLFLDEPTVGVDPALRVQFWTHFRRLASAGTTILVASHVMDEADRCDELLFMRGGKVIGQGTGVELRARAGTDSLEDAFLHLAGLDPEGRPIDAARRPADAQGPPA